MADVCVHRGGSPYKEFGSLSRFWWTLQQLAGDTLYTALREMHSRRDFWTRCNSLRHFCPSRQAWSTMHCKTHRCAQVTGPVHGERRRLQLSQHFTAGDLHSGPLHE